MKTGTIVAAVLVVVLIAGGAFFLMSDDDNTKDDTPAEKETVTVTDVIGRTITLELPVERVAILDTGMLDIFSVAVGEGWEKYVCMMPGDMEQREALKADIIYDKYPELKKLPHCPPIFTQDSSIAIPPSEDIIAANPDVVIVDGAIISYAMDLFKPWLDSMDKAGIKVFCPMFYQYSYQPDVAQKNYGVIGEFMGTQEQAKKAVDLYNGYIDKFNKILTPEKKKSFYYYVELDGGLGSATYGQVAGMGAMELEMLGGKNVNPEMMHNMNWSIEDMYSKDFPEGPDMMVIVNTSYAGGASILGHGATGVEDTCNKYLQGYVDRDGWDQLKAVKDGNVSVAYGELRNSMFGILDLYNYAAAEYPELFTKAMANEVQQALDDLCPWGMSGTFMYTFD